MLATAAWLGGLVALAAVLIPRENLQELDRLIPRFSVVATVSVIILVATGTVHALAVAGGIGPLVSSRYGLVLLIKVAVFGLMLVLGNHGRHYAARVAFRRVHHRSESPELTAHVQRRAGPGGGDGCRTGHRVRNPGHDLDPGHGCASRLMSRSW